MSKPETASFREFADMVPCKPSWVTQLRKDDRLVLTEDGKRVRVLESLRRIEETRDPSKRGVALRHAQARAESASGEQPVDQVDNGIDGDAADGDAPAKSDTYQHWRERGERAKALAAERENDIAERKLLRADEIEPAVSSAFTLIRARVEALPEVLGDELAIMTDPAQVRARMREEIEHLLSETSAKLEEIGKAAA